MMSAVRKAKAKREPDGEESISLSPEEKICVKKIGSIHVMVALKK